MAEIATDVSEEMPLQHVTWGRLDAAVRMGVCSYVPLRPVEGGGGRGSARIVEDPQIAMLEGWGMACDRIALVALRCAGAATMSRLCTDLDERLRMKSVGLVLLPDECFDITVEGNNFISFLGLHGLLLMLRGVVYDPSDAGHVLSLGLISLASRRAARCRCKEYASA